MHVKKRLEGNTEMIIVCCDKKAVTPTLTAHLSPLGASVKHRIPGSILRDSVSKMKSWGIQF